MPCSYDCVTGSWSPWSPCSRPCASQLHVGYTQRNTSVVAPPGPGACLHPRIPLCIAVNTPAIIALRFALRQSSFLTAGYDDAEMQLSK